MKFTPFWLFVFAIGFAKIGFAQNQDSTSRPQKNLFLQKATHPNKTRLWAVSGGTFTAYAGASLGLNYVWYAQYPRQRFHFFNDWSGWRGMDKAGHAFTAYFESQIVSDLYQWAGLSPHKSALIGAGAGLLFQTTLETMDAFSAGWGWSWGDMGFNTLGAGLYYTQARFWGEQRLKIKFSFHTIRYSQQPIQAENGSTTTTAAARAANLFGNSPQNQLLKEYNGQTLWLSVNPYAFFKQKNSPKWAQKLSFLNIAAGYSVENLLGAEQNRWKDAQGNVFSLTQAQMPRYSQFFLSLDIDWERIPTRRRWLKMVFKGLNYVKIPFPAIEFNTLGRTKSHWLYF